MKDNFDVAFAQVMKSEGGYVWDKDDAGGETNLGVTIGAWGAYLNRAIQPGEMKALTIEQVKPFYRTMYWDKVKGDDLPKGIDYAVFDFAVNAGVGRAAKFLQRAVSVTDDGNIGPGTLAAVAKSFAKTVLANFSKQKEDFYRGLAEKNASQQKFLKGWLARLDHVNNDAIDMC